MSLKPVVDALDGVGADEQQFYSKAEDGKFYLDVDRFTSGLRSALEKERSSRKEFEKKAKRGEEFGDLDPAEVKALYERFSNDERAKLIKDGKWDEALNIHTDKMRKDHQKQLDALKMQIEQADARAQRYVQRALESSLREAASKAGLHPYAIEDALLHGRNLFTIDEEGNAVQLDKDGDVIKGKNGKDAFSPLEWLESMRESKPHWFPASGSGSGAPASNSRGNSRGKTIKRSAFDQLNPAERVATIKEGVTVVD